MACSECNGLNAELRARIREQWFAAECLGRVGEKTEPYVYAKLYKRLSDARIEHELARLALNNHQRDGHAEKAITVT